MTMQTKTRPSTSQTAPQREVPAAPGGDEPRRTPVRNFARHYAEMLVVMFLGMFVLGFGLVALLEAAGVDASDWDRDAPALFLLSMAVYMTVPMVAWMRYCGHRWGLAAEMSAAMFVPTFAVIALLWAGAGSDVHGLMGIQHVAMFPAMLGVMLLRRDEYTGR
jgi:hypothetical protein